MFCPNCGKEYQDNQNYCRFCGTKLNVNSEIIADENLEITNEVEDTEPKTDICDDNIQNDVADDILQDENADGDCAKVENSSVDLTVKNVVDELDENDSPAPTYETSSESSSEDDKDDVSVDNDVDNDDTDDSEGFFFDLKNSLIQNTPDGIKLTPSAITLLVVLFLFIVFMSNLLWSINDAIQINPEMTNENALMNIPNDNDDGAYTQAPEPVEEETPEENSDENQETQTYSEEPQQIEEPPIVPIEEIRQREQQFPEPEIPTPQDFSEEIEH